MGDILEYTIMGIIGLLGVALVLAVVGTIGFHITHKCVRSHEVTYQHMNQGVLIGNEHFKIPVGGGDIETRTKNVCDEYAWR